MHDVHVRRIDYLLRMHERLRNLTRLAEGLPPEPAEPVVIAQAARPTVPGAAERGFDAGRKAFGRKRHILVDAAGLILLAYVTARQLHGTFGARRRAFVGGEVVEDDSVAGREG